MKKTDIGRISIVSLLLFTLALATGCSTLIKGTTQEVAINSHPSGASVFVNNQSFGQTPTFVKLRRNSNYTILLEMPGFAPYEIKLDRKTNITFWVNIPVLGQVVDALSGAMYQLTPEEINKQFAQQQPTTSPTTTDQPTSSETNTPMTPADTNMQTMPADTTQPEPAPDTSGTSWLPDENTYYIFVTMNPDPSWKKIGQLTPLKDSE